MSSEANAYEVQRQQLYVNPGRSSTVEGLSACLVSGTNFSVCAGLQEIEPALKLWVSVQLQLLYKAGQQNLPPSMTSAA